MELEFIWKQAQLAKEKDFELEGLKSLLSKSEAEVKRLEEVEKDLKELIGCIILFSDKTGGYISQDKWEIARLIKEKYNEQV